MHDDSYDRKDQISDQVFLVGQIIHEYDDASCYGYGIDEYYKAGDILIPGFQHLVMLDIIFPIIRIVIALIKSFDVDCASPEDTNQDDPKYYKATELYH